MMNQKIEELKKLILESNNDELSKLPGHVYQVWEDGEITLQKSGSLLWKRTLHSIVPGVAFKISSEWFPYQTGRDNIHGYAFVTEENAYKIRKAILELSKEDHDYYIKSCDNHIAFMEKTKKENDKN